jgi:hypothetical protein
MALTRSFKILVQQHVAKDPAFAAALLHEGIDITLSSDVDTGNAILPDYIGDAGHRLRTLLRKGGNGCPHGLSWFMMNRRLPIKSLMHSDWQDTM